MDTIRIKKPFSLPTDNYYFKEKVRSRDIDDLHIPIKGTRSIYTNQSWRKEMRNKEIYIPKYWIEEDYFDPNKTYLVLEFSVQKLLYGNNLNEYRKEDFDLLVSKIVDFLSSINLKFFDSQIYEFTPIVIAYGKNIDLSDFCTCDLAINVLSPFNYRPRSKTRKILFEDGEGKELHFGNKNSSLKVYEKLPEIVANAVTKQEKEFANTWKNNCNQRYKSSEAIILEILRFEYTLKNKTAIKQKIKPHFSSYPNFKDIFSKIEIWEDILKEEINNVYNHPLKNFLFLATMEKPAIDAFLDMHCKAIKTKDTARGILLSLQEKGLATTRRQYINNYCRKTWYNYIARLKELEKQIDFSSPQYISLIDTHCHIMKKLGISTNYQMKMDL